MTTLFRSLQMCTRRLASYSPPQRLHCTSSQAPTVIGTSLSRDKYPEAVLNALSLENASRSEHRQARKQGIIERYRRSPSDTGSPEVQIAILTDRIKDLTGHCVAFRKDKHNKRRLISLVNKRRSLMQYLLRKDASKFFVSHLRI